MFYKQARVSLYVSCNQSSFALSVPKKKPHDAAFYIGVVVF